MVYGWSLIFLSHPPPPPVFSISLYYEDESKKKCLDPVFGPKLEIMSAFTPKADYRPAAGPKECESHASIHTIPSYKLLGS